MNALNTTLNWRETYFFGAAMQVLGAVAYGIFAIPLRLSSEWHCFQRLSESGIIKIGEVRIVMRLSNIAAVEAGPLKGQFALNFMPDCPPDDGNQKKILILHDYYPFYLAKCHEALLTGLSSCFDVKFYGAQRAGYFEASSLEEVIKRLYGEERPDIILMQVGMDKQAFIKPHHFLSGIAEFEGVTCVQLGDFWNILPEYLENYVDSVLAYNIDFVLSYFPHPLFILEHSRIAERILYLLPSFDPRVFNNWGLVKDYDIGFLAAGTQDPSPYYPERHHLHKKLLEKNNFRYLTASHPGREAGSLRLTGPHPFAGKNFSLHINACRGFINTGGVYKTPNARTVEVLASGTLLFAFEHFDLGALHLEDGISYVCIDEHNALDKIDYYLSKPELSRYIAEAGYKIAMKYHSAQARANQLKAMLLTKMR